MFPSESDAFERLNTLVRSSNYSRAYSRSVGADPEKNDWTNVILSAKNILSLLSIGLAFICIVAYFIILWHDRKPAEARSAASAPGSWPQRSYRNVLQKALERLERCWSKVFSKGSSKRKGCPAIRIFRSRSKSEAGDLEMQQTQPISSPLHEPRDFPGVTGNRNPAGPALLISTQDTRRPQGQEHLQTGRGSPMGRAVEAERQRLRDAWDRLEISVPAAEALPVILPRHSGPPARTVSPATPERSVGLTTQQVGHAPRHIYGSIPRGIGGSPAPSILEPPPPTYAQHTDDEVAHLHDCQDRAQAAEGVGGVPELPPYALSWPPAPAAVHSSRRPLAN